MFLSVSKTAKSTTDGGFGGSYQLICAVEISMVARRVFLTEGQPLNSIGSFAKHAVLFFLTGLIGLICESGWARDERMISKHDASSNSVDDPIAGFLKGLPESLRANPSLIYRSRSIQESSWQSPRVILADKTSNVVYAFNGDSAQKGYDRIEAMEFNPTAARFTFFEIKIDSVGVPVRSPDNPVQCMVCHRGPDPRPNWESYDHWVGVYGSNDDRLTDEEVGPFKEFLTSGLARPRYNALNMDSKKAVLLFSSHHGRLPDEPNISLTHILSEANFKRVARLIMETKDYERYKFLIVGFLNTPGVTRDQLLEFLPEGANGYGGHDAIFDYYSRAEIDEAKLISTLNYGAIGDEYSTPPALLFRSIFESRGIDVSGWFMNFKAGLTNNFVNGTPWEEQLLLALLERDPTLKKFVYTGSDSQMDQGRLVDASLAQLSGQQKSVIRKFASDALVPERIWVGSCAGCHVQRSLGFAPQMTWEEARRHPSFKRLIETGRMPKDQVLTESQKRRLLGN